MYVLHSGSHSFVTFAMTYPLPGTLSSLFPCETHTHLRDGAWEQNFQSQALLGGGAFNEAGMEKMMFGGGGKACRTLTLAQQLRLQNTKSLTLQRPRVHVGSEHPPCAPIHSDLLRVSLQQACTEMYVQDSQVSDSVFGRKSTRWSMSKLAEKAKQVLLLQNNPSVELPSRTVWATLFNNDVRRKRTDDISLPESKTTVGIRSEFRSMVDNRGAAQLRAAWNRFQKFESSRSSNKARLIFDRLGIQVYYKPNGDHQEEHISLLNYTMGYVDDGYLAECVRMIVRQLDLDTHKFRDGVLEKGWHSVHDVALACCMRLPDAQIRSGDGYTSWNNVEVLCTKIVYLSESAIGVVWDPQTRELPHPQRLLQRDFDVTHKRKRGVDDDDDGSSECTEEACERGNDQATLQQMWDQVGVLYPDNLTHSEVHTMLQSDVGDILADVEEMFIGGGDEAASSALHRRLDALLPPAYDGEWTGVKSGALREALQLGVHEVIISTVLGLGVEADQCQDEVRELNTNGKLEAAWRHMRHFYLLSLWACRRNTFISHVLQNQ
jgi:hypothetical protein